MYEATEYRNLIELQESYKSGYANDSQPYAKTWLLMTPAFHSVDS